MPPPPQNGVAGCAQRTGFSSKLASHPQQGLPSSGLFPQLSKRKHGTRRTSKAPSCFGKSAIWAKGPPFPVGLVLSPPKKSWLTGNCRDPGRPEASGPSAPGLLIPPTGHAASAASSGGALPRPRRQALLSFPQGTSTIARWTGTSSCWQASRSPRPSCLCGSLVAMRGPLTAQLPTAIPAGTGVDTPPSPPSSFSPLENRQQESQPGFFVSVYSVPNVRMQWFP